MDIMTQYDSHKHMGNGEVKPCEVEKRNDILADYQPLKHMGHGMFGVTILCRRQTELVVIKITHYRPSPTREKHEGDIACLVQQLPGFIRVHGVYIAETLPENWYAWTRDFSHQGPWLIIDMERADGSLYTLLEEAKSGISVLQWDDIRSILLQVIFSLWVGWQEYGLCHQDVKLENIVYKMEAHPLHIETDTMTLHIDSPYRIRLIDFGVSQVLDTTVDYCSDMLGLAMSLPLFMAWVQTSEHRQQLQELKHHLDAFEVNDAILLPMFQDLLQIAP